MHSIDRSVVFSNCRALVTLSISYLIKVLTLSARKFRVQVWRFMLGPSVNLINVVLCLHLVFEQDRCLSGPHQQAF